MSRIGKKPIVVPAGVDVKFADGVLNVAKGNTKLTQKIHPNISLAMNDGVITLDRKNDQKENRALHGLMRSLVFNMVTGVNEGFTKTLEINGIGYSASKNGKTLVLKVGYSHPVEVVEPDGITLEVPANNRILVKGADKQLVGETAAKIRSIRLPDAYKGKGIKYDTEVLKLKEGKTGAK